MIFFFFFSLKAFIILMEYINIIYIRLLHFFSQNIERIRVWHKITYIIINQMNFYIEFFFIFYFS